MNITQIINEEISKVLNKNRGLLKRTGERFWIGSVNVYDGEIEEVHTYEHAYNSDFHHSMYFSQPQLEKIDNEECMVFWIDSTGIQGQWTHGQISRNIESDILSQIEII